MASTTGYADVWLICAGCQPVTVHDLAHRRTGTTVQQLLIGSYTKIEQALKVMSWCHLGQHQVLVC